MTIGVVIGRFQIDALHPGHERLLDHVTREHSQVLILVGVRPSPATRTDPLSFLTRARMLAQRYPKAVVMPITDMRSDKEWVKQVDTLITSLFNTDATIYGCRESCLPIYATHGRHRTQLLDTTTYRSSTLRRAEIATEGVFTAAERKGAIHALQTLTPRLFMCTDIAVWRHTGAPGKSVLMVGKAGEDGWRVPGGHVDLTDTNLEMAARRELTEETGLNVEGPLTYVGSYTIDDWRDRGLTDAKHVSVLYTAEHGWGVPLARDDIARWCWLPLESEASAVMPEHQPLWLDLVAHL